MCVRVLFVFYRADVCDLLSVCALNVIVWPVCALVRVVVWCVLLCWFVYFVWRVCVWFYLVCVLCG